MQGQMALMGPAGDTKILWNSDVPEEVENARESFNRMVGKGFMAFRTDKKGDRGEQLREFDPAAEKIILVKQMRGG